MKKTDLINIMKMAWRFANITGYSFAVCLKKSWANYKLYKAMQNNVCEFFYMKTDGTTRQAFGTLKHDVVDPLITGSGRKPNENVFTYYDTEKQEFRCFKRYNIMSIATSIE